ncbi:MAG: VanZ family protein [Faecalimonas sp.]|nr:VanZ family protein [Faecalimonas sp.]
MKKKIIFGLYIFFLLYFLIFSEIYGRSGVMQDYHYNLTPFQEIERFWRYREQLGLMSYINLFGNVLIFVPFGFMEPLASKKRSFWATLIDGCLVSLAVEIFQFITKVGRFDVDDLMLNTTGVALGYMCFLVWNAIRRKYGTKG